MNDDPNVIARNPVLVLSAIGVAVVAVLDMLIAVFGLPLTADGEAKVEKAVVAVGFLVVVYLIHRKTEASATVVAKRDGGAVVAGDAAPAPTGEPVPVAMDPADGKPVALVKLAS